jgi:hypothetical protein
MEELVDETMGHLFWECPNVREVIQQVCNDVANTLNIRVNKKNYLCGVRERTKDASLLSIIFVHRIKFMIYKCKTRRRIPTLFYMRTELNDFLSRLGRYGRWSWGVHQIAEIARKILNE